LFVLLRTPQITAMTRFFTVGGFRLPETAIYANLSATGLTFGSYNVWGRKFCLST
jgi:hypothetical protein